MNSFDLLLRSITHKKGRLRWLMVAWIFLMLLCIFIDRVNLAMAAPLIMAEFQLSPSMLGLVMSGFMIGYTILTFSGGFLVARFSARIIMTVVLVLRSVATIVTGCVWGFVSLLLTRIGFGLAEGPLMPAVNSTVNHWMLGRERRRRRDCISRRCRWELFWGIF